MDTIKFANGAVYDCAFVSTGPFDGGMNAHIALANVTFSEAASIFSNENMTREMEWGQYRLVGYTDLVSLRVQPYGIQAMLKGGHDERLN